jgi:glycosyltransferase involved in cell wall biosynthesis
VAPVEKHRRPRAMQRPRTPAAAALAGALHPERVLTRYAVKADAIALPGFAGGIQLAPMEAMAFAVSCVTTFITGMPELVEHCDNSPLLPSSDATPQATGLARQRDDPDLRLAALFSHRMECIHACQSVQQPRPC